MAIQRSGHYVPKENAVHKTVPSDLRGANKGKVKYRCGRAEFLGSKGSWNWDEVTCRSCIYQGRGEHNRKVGK